VDSDLIWSTRMKSIIAEDHPTILGFDEQKFAASLFYREQNPIAAIELFNLNLRQFTRVLRALPDSIFLRTGQHSERGTIVLGDVLKLMVWHVDHHIGFIAKKRQALSKPLKDYTPSKD
jgi:hypothetical protein